MIQVSTFVSDDEEKLDEHINTWIKDKIGIYGDLEIIDIKFSSFSPYDDMVEYCAMVIYNTNNENK